MSIFEVKYVWISFVFHKQCDREVFVIHVYVCCYDFRVAFVFVVVAIYHIFIMLLYFKLGQSRSTGMNVPCEDAKSDINDRIRGGSTACVDNYLKESEGEDEFDDQLLFDHLVDSNETAETTEMDIFTWINDIKRDATNAVQAEDDGNRDNLMENKPFADYFIKLCHMLPIWSAVCCPIFNSPHLIASSWSSETGFKNTKQLHGDKLPCSVDEFVKCDLDFNNSTAVDASKKYLAITKKNTQPKSKEKSAKTPANRKIRNLDPTETENDEVLEPQSDFSGSIDASSALNDENRNVEVQTAVACPVCADGNLPTGAHKCFSCGKSVHILSGCSVSIGAEEGYGEKRQCIACFRSTTSAVADQSETQKALNARESWSRKQKKSSKYLKPQPNFGLVPINKKTTIPLLINENRITTVYNIDKQKRSFANSCGIDAPLTLTAAGFAYHPAYSISMANKNDEFLRIAKMMATG